jgi:hypothetical protein
MAGMIFAVPISTFREHLEILDTGLHKYLTPESKQITKINEV